jgi:hypothetical protein
MSISTGALPVSTPVIVPASLIQLIVEPQVPT